ncbi:MAG: branched-chain amino acid ABC transporter permease [Acidimicrobiales bacterium]
MTAAAEWTARIAARPRSTLLRHLLWSGVGLVAFYLISIALSDFQDLQLAQISYTAIAAAGLTVLSGHSGQISLGHGALMAIGAYTTAVLLLHTHLPLIVILLVSVVSGTVAGAAVGAVAARLRGPYLAGATLALAVGLPQIPKNYKYFGRDQGLTINPPQPPAWLGTSMTIERWGAYICVIGAVIALLLLANLGRSRYGRGFRAVRDEEIAASLAGIPVARTQVLAFMVSSACAGLGGGLLALVIPTVGPGGFTLDLSIRLLVAIVIGGMGSLGGAVIGAVVLVYLPSWATSISGGLGLSQQIGANLALAIFGAVLIVVMLAFPGGIVGALRRLSVLIRSRRGADRPDPQMSPRPETVR